MDQLIDKVDSYTVLLQKYRTLEIAALVALHYLETPGDFLGSEKRYIIEDLDSALHDPEPNQ